VFFPLTLVNVGSLLSLFKTVAASQPLSDATCLVVEVTDLSCQLFNGALKSFFLNLQYFHGLVWIVSRAFCRDIDTRMLVGVQF